MDIQSAEKAARGGAIAGFIIAGLSAAIISAAVYGQVEFFEFLDDPWNYLDVALITGLSFGVLRRSRVSAVCLFLFYFLSQLLFMIEAGAPTGILATLAILYFFGRGIMGTFAYHRIRREQDPEYRPAGRAMYFVSIPVGLIGVLLAGLMVIGALAPTTGVVAGDDLSPDDLRILLDEGIIEPDEHIVLFYSAGLFSVREDGSLLTETRVISYEETDEELWIGSAFFDEVTKVSVEEPGDLFSDTLVLLALADGNGFYLLLSAEEGGDARFLNELEKRME